LSLEDLESTTDLKELLGTRASVPRPPAREHAPGATPDLFTSAPEAANAPADPPEEASDAADAGGSPALPAKPGGLDLFAVVWPHLERVLATPRSDQEVAVALNIQPGQARAWLHHAVELGRVQRLSRPARYELSPQPITQLQLLDAGSGLAAGSRPVRKRRRKDPTQIRGHAGGD
jgi:hypothetical protein